MKGFARLVGNENRKTLRQTGMRVLLIIIAAITALSPLLDFAISKLTSSVSYTDYRYDPENINSMIEWAREEGDALDEEYWRVYDETVRFFDDNGINAGWQINAFRSEYTEALGLLRTCELLSSGKYTAEELEGSMFGEFMWYYEAPAETQDADIADIEIETDFSAFSPENIAATLEDARKSYEKIKSRALGFTLADYYASLHEDAQAEYDEQAKTVEAVKAGKDIPSTGDAQLDADLLAYNIAYEETKLRGCELALWGYRQLADNVWEYGGWQYKTVANLISRLGSSAPSAVMSEALFISEEYSGNLHYFYKSYGDYADKTKAEQAAWDEAAALARYSLENNIPIKGTVSNSSKQLFRSELKSSMSLLAIFMIVLACMTLSGEYTSGTVRLLLIRPRSRAKIIGSKLASMLVLWLSAIAAAAVMLFLECLLLFGVGDIFKPDLFYIGGRAVASPAALTLIFQILLDMLSSAPIILFGFMLSVWVKKSALPIALSMIGRFSSSLALMLSVSLNNEFPMLHLEYSPLPYLDLTEFIGNAAERFVNTDISTLSDLINQVSGVGIASDPTYVLGIGIAWMAGLAALELVLSFVSFTRQQIKN